MCWVWKLESPDKVLFFPQWLFFLDHTITLTLFSAVSNTTLGCDTIIKDLSWKLGPKKKKVFN